MTNFWQKQLKFTNSLHAIHFFDPFTSDLYFCASSRAPDFRVPRTLARNWTATQAVACEQALFLGLAQKRRSRERLRSFAAPPLVRETPKESVLAGFHLTENAPDWGWSWRNDFWLSTRHQQWRAAIENSYNKNTKKRKPWVITTLLVRKKF